MTDFHKEPENECLERLAGRLPVLHGAAMFRFTPGGKVQHMIHLIKYRGHRIAAKRLGMAYGTKMKDGLFPEDPLLLPVPLHKNRKRLRGFNQSDHYAMGLARTTSWKMSTESLVRIRDTSTQTEMTRDERLENLRGAFAVARPDQIDGADVILVDDILTTGATLEACGSVLVDHCRSISFVTIAVAV